MIIIRQYYFRKTVSLLTNDEEFQMNEQSWIRKIFNFFLRNWFVSSIISIVPIAVSAYTDLWGTQITGKTCRTILTILIIISITFTCVKNICTSIDDKKRRQAENYYQSLTQRNIGTTVNIIEDIVGVVSEGRYKNISKPLAPFCNDSSRVNPCTRIKSFCEDAKNILSKHFDSPEDDIAMSIYVRDTIDKGDDAEWQFLFQTNVSKGDLKAKEVSEQNGSAFNMVKDNVGTVYFREKKNALSDGHYIMTQNERTNGLKGNIYYENISLVDFKNNVLLPLVFCVATYEVRICSDKDYFAVEKAKKLLSKVGMEVKYEIANLLLYHHMGFRENLIQR